MTFQCSHCLGLGYIVSSPFSDLPLEAMDDIEMQETDDSTCPVCRGTGYVDDLDFNDPPQDDY